MLHTDRERVERWLKRVEGNVSDCQVRCMDHWTLTESVSTCGRNRESGWRDPLHSTRRKPRLARRQFCRGRLAIPVKSSRHHRLVKAVRDPVPLTRLIPAIIRAGSSGRGRQAWTAGCLLALAKLSGDLALCASRCTHGSHPAIAQHRGIVARLSRCMGLTCAHMPVLCAGSIPSRDDISA